MNDSAIQTRGLTRRFGRVTAVKNLELTVPKGSIYGFLGRNGAGKTTTIKMLMGLLRPTCGTAEVLGCAVRNDGVRIRSLVGYVPEDRKMYHWMRVREILRFTSAFYPTWDTELAQSLVNRLNLDQNQRIKTLSRGMVAKVSLILALAHRPQLLVLDDPTSGLDPIVRREFLESMVDLVHEGTKTVFFSSHVLSDIERTCDWVGLLANGHLRKEARIEDLKASVKTIQMRFDGEPSGQFPPEGTVTSEEKDGIWSITVENFSDQLVEQLSGAGAQSIQVIDLALEDIFIAYLGTEEGL